MPRLSPSQGWELPAARLPAWHPGPQGPLWANPAMGVPTDPRDLRGETLQAQAAAWQEVPAGAAQRRGHTATARRVGRRNGRRAACRPGKLEPFPGCCQLRCKKLLLGGDSRSLMGLGVFVPPSNGNSRCLLGCSGSGQLYSQGRSVAKRNSRESKELALGGP